MFGKNATDRQDDPQKEPDPNEKFEYYQRLLEKRVDSYDLRRFNNYPFYGGYTPDRVFYEGLFNRDQKTFRHPFLIYFSTIILLLCLLGGIAQLLDNLWQENNQQLIEQGIEPGFPVQLIID